MMNAHTKEYIDWLIVKMREHHRESTHKATPAPVREQHLQRYWAYKNAYQKFGEINGLTE